MRLSIRHQIVGPFVVLVVFVGIVGTAVVMTHFAQATEAEFDGSLLRSSLLANDHLAIQEADRIQLLRAAADTQGVADAITAGDHAALLRLLSPVLANAGSPDLLLHVLDRQGTEVLRLRGANEVPVTAGGAPGYAGTSEMQAVLAGRRDAAGDKYAFVYPDASGPMLFWAGPVRADDLSVSGGIVLGQPLASIASGIEGSRASDLVFFDTRGHTLYSSLAGQAPLEASVLGQISSDHPARVLESVDNHSYGLLVSDWRLRDRPVGYLGVALLADGWQASLAQLRLLLVVLFAAAALLALLVGVALARSIAQPIDHLVRAVRKVAAGDLHHRAPPGPANEIGYLTTAFNEMTAGLEDKTQPVSYTHLTLPTKA